MNKQNFIDYIHYLEQYNNIVDDWSSLGLNFYETSMYDNMWQILALLEKQLFTVEGRDWISWYLYERLDIHGNILPWYDEEGKEHITKTPEDLWEIVEEYLIHKN